MTWDPAVNAEVSARNVPKAEQLRYDHEHRIDFVDKARIRYIYRAQSKVKA